MVVGCVGLLLLSLNTPYHGSIPLNEKSWTYPSGYDPHGGYVDRLRFIVYPSEDIDAALFALQSGYVYSYDERIPHQSVPELQANPDIGVTSELGNSYRQFTMNCDRFPTNITGYRRALSYALNKYAVVMDSRGGFAQVMDNPIPLAFEFWTYEDQMTTHYYSEDIVSANATLDAAHIIDTPDSPHPGWRYYDADLSGTWTEGIDKRGDDWAPDGLRIDIFVSQGYEPAIQAGLVLVESMEKCGLMGDLAEPWGWIPFSEWSSGCFSWSINPPGDPTLLYDFFYSESGNNRFFYRFNNSEYDYNCSRFMDASTRLEARNWAWNCCRILMKEMPMIVCYNDEYTHAYRTDTWEGYVNWVTRNRMGGNPYTFQQIRLKEDAGGPFGCIPTEYVTVLSDGMDFTNTILSSSRYTQTIMGLIYSTLWSVDPLDPFSEPAPDLAYNWTIQPTVASGDIQEGMKYTFHLHDNITWHDGTPFNSADVQYSLMTIHPSISSYYTADNVERIYRVDTPDNHTVEIYSNSTGYVEFTESTSVQILPKHIWSPYESGNFSWSPVTPEDFTGTGCFRWVSRITGQEIILDRYDGWHFAIDHPPRSTCPQSPIPPWLAMILIMGVLIILLQVFVLSIFLKRRRKGVITKEEKAQEIQ